MGKAYRVNALRTMFYHWGIMIISGFSLLLNVLVFCIFVRFRRKLLYGYGVTRRACNSTVKNHNILLFSLVVSDLLSSIFGLVFGVLLKCRQPRRNYRLFGSIPLYGFMFVSILALGFLTIDRLAAVIRPLRYPILMSKFCVKGMVVVSWVVPVLFMTSQCLVYYADGVRTELKIRGCFLTLVFMFSLTALLISNLLLILKARTIFMRFKRTNDHHLNSAASKSRQINSNESTPNIDTKTKQEAKIFRKVSPLTYKGKLSRFGTDSNSSMPTINGVRQNRLVVGSSTQLQGNLEPTEENLSGRLEKSKAKVFSLSRDYCLVGKLTEMQERDCGGEDEIFTAKIDTPPMKKITRVSKTLTEPEHLEDIPVNSGFLNTRQTLINNDAIHRQFVVNRPCNQLEKRILRTNHKSINYRENKMTVVCICIITVFLIAWLPLIGYRLSYVIGRDKAVVWLRRLSLCVAMANSILNPCFYFLLRQDFRSLLWNLVTETLAKLRCRNKSEELNS